MVAVAMWERAGRGRGGGGRQGPDGRAGGDQGGPPGRHPRQAPAPLIPPRRLSAAAAAARHPLAAWRARAHSAGGRGGAELAQGSFDYMFACHGRVSGSESVFWILQPGAGPGLLDHNAPPSFPPRGWAETRGYCPATWAGISGGPSRDRRLGRDNDEYCGGSHAKKAGTSAIGSLNTNAGAKNSS